MRNRSIFLARGIIAAFFTTAAFADTISTWNGGSGNWSTASDWTPPVVPNNSASNTYDVTIGSGGQVGLDISPMINSLSIATGILYATPGANPQLTVTNNAVINGGALLFGTSGTGLRAMVQDLCRSVEI